MGFKNYNVERKKKEEMISPRIELGTFCVLSRCHNRLDHETIFLGCLKEFTGQGVATGGHVSEKLLFFQKFPSTEDLKNKKFKKRSDFAQDRTGDVLRVKQMP